MKDNNSLKELVRDYWQNVDGKYDFSIKDLNHKYGLNLKEILTTISNVKAYINFGNCNSCDRENAVCVKNRSNAKTFLEDPYYHYFCETCRNKAVKHCKYLTSLERKNIWMQLSFKYHLWKKLNKDEINFLKAIYYLKRWDRIEDEIVKLDKKYCNNVLYKLNRMNLISISKNDITKEFTLNMLDGLENLIEQKRI